MAESKSAEEWRHILAAHAGVGPEQVTGYTLIVTLRDSPYPAIISDAGPEDLVLARLEELLAWLTTGPRRSVFVRSGPLHPDEGGA